MNRILLHPLLVHAERSYESFLHGTECLKTEDIKHIQALKWTRDSDKIHYFNHWRSPIMVDADGKRI